VGISWKKPTAGIILAAGVSQRFGQPKQLLKLGGKCVIEWVLDASLTSRLESIFLVLGYRYQSILKALGAKANHPRIQVVINNRYRQGQSSSLRTGIFQISKIFPSAMFLLGDQPMVDSRTIDRLLEQFWFSKKNICVPIYQNERGNPTIFSRKYYDQIQNIKGDIGARQLIEDNPAQVLEVKVENPLCFFDIDTEEDFKKIQSLVVKSRSRE